MELTYDRLSSDELQGTTQADYLIALDARLRLTDGEVVVFDEPGFPVVELARSLVSWLEAPMYADFEFDSMSFEGTGVFALRERDGRWAFEWSLGTAVAPRPLSRAEVERTCTHFIARVVHDLRALGLEPETLVRRRARVREWSSATGGAA